MGTDMILADPTVAGHEPGQGPLRPGGQAADLEDFAPASKVDRPDKRSPRSEAQMGELALCRDLFAGAKRVKGARALYLPQSPGEVLRDYNARLARSVFFNVFKQTVVGLVGLIFRRDPVLSEDMPSVLQKDWENIDLAGTHGDVFVKQLEGDALTAGHAAILVEFPAVPEGLNRAQEMELRPYWVPVRKEDIMSWRTDNLDGVTVLTQVVLRTSSYVEVGLFGEQLMTTYLVIQRAVPALEEKDPVTWQVLAVSKKGVVSKLREGAYRNQVEIPLAEVVTSGDEGLLTSTPPLVDLGHLNVAHYQMWSDYATSIHKTCVPLLALYGVEPPKDGEKREIVVGANTVLTFRNPQSTAEYVSHSGESIDSVKAALNDLKSDMGTLGLAMLAPQKRVAETAEAKRVDKATTDSALAATARGLQDGCNRALQFHARYRGLDPKQTGTVVINRDFEGLLTEAPVMQAYTALVEAGFPPRIVLRKLQEGGRIPEDEDLEVLEAEWEANRMAEQVQRDLEEEVDGGATDE